MCLCVEIHGKILSSGEVWIINFSTHLRICQDKISNNYIIPPLYIDLMNIIIMKNSVYSFNIIEKR